MADSLLTRVAKEMYRKDPGVMNRTDFGSLSTVEQTRYERLASVALSVVLHEPAEPDLLITS